MIYSFYYFKRLQIIVYGDFIAQKPKKAVRLLVSRLQPPPVRHGIRRRVECDPKLEKISIC